MNAVKLVERLNNEFGFEMADGMAVREWSKEVDVAWHGKMTSHFKVTVLPEYEACVLVRFYLNNREIKARYYNSKEGTIINAIKNTVAFHDYEF